MSTRWITSAVYSLIRGTLVGVGILGFLSLWHVDQADADSFLLPSVKPKIILETHLSESDVLEDFASQTDASVIAFMAEYIVTLESTDWPGGYRGDFLEDVAPAALISAHQHHIPPSIIIGQAIFESGWGRSNLAVHFNNLFGIKGTGENTVKIRTFERNSRNRRYGKWAKFRIFEDRPDAIFYHGRLLSKDRRYASALEHTTDWRVFMDKASTYYASDPNYSKKLAVIIEDYDLDRWDRLINFVSDPERVTSK